MFFSKSSRESFGWLKCSNFELSKTLSKKSLHQDCLKKFSLFVDIPHEFCFPHVNLIWEKDGSNNVFFAFSSIKKCLWSKDWVKEKKYEHKSFRFGCAPSRKFDPAESQRTWIRFVSTLNFGSLTQWLGLRDGWDSLDIKFLFFDFVVGTPTTFSSTENNFVLAVSGNGSKRKTTLASCFFELTISFTARLKKAGECIFYFIVECFIM